MILVTGGTGLIGAHLLLHLCETEQKVRAIYRTKDKIELVKSFFSSEKKAALYENIEWIQADITYTTTLEIAFKDITHVYHCAGLISFDPADYIKLRQTNIEGTANIVNFCIAYKIEKLCYVSTIATLGDSINNKPIDESTDWNPETENNAYAITKYGAEMEVWRGTQEGVPCFIVNPGVILGEGFWNSPSNAFFKLVKKGISYFPTGNTAFVDVKDVVKAMLLGMNSKIVNQRYITISGNESYQNILEQIATSFNVKPPKRALKNWHLAILWRIDWLAAHFPTRKRKLSKNAAKSLSSNSFYSNNKIKTEFEFKFTPIEKAIERIAMKYPKT